MREAVLEHLTGFGVTGAESDPFLDYVIRNVKAKVQNLTNRADMPEGLKSIAAYMAVGEYLSMKKGSGQLEGFDLEAAEKQITEGDTTVAYATESINSPEQRLDSLIEYLMNGRTAELYHFRRLRW